MKLLAFVAAASLAACGGTKPEATDDFSALAGVDEKSDAFSKHMTLVGSLDYGTTSKPTAYTSNPTYRAFKFGGAQGDAVDIWVRSTTGGDAVAWLLDDSFKIVAKNDDADHTTLDSHIKATLPANNDGTITYYIVFRDYDLAKGTFTVELAKTNCVQNVFCTTLSHWDSKACKCVPNSCVQTQLCVQGSTWDSSQCKCVPGCVYNDTTYAVGAGFPATDGCNNCSCSSAGHVVCTTRACPAPDCRTAGCSGVDQQCVFCWGSYACIPKGAVC